MRTQPFPAPADGSDLQLGEQDGSGQLRRRILEAALALVEADGPEAATTRAVSTAASIQPPTLYRLFGDKRGLLDAVAEHALAGHVTAKADLDPHPDPVEDLRRGWDRQVAWCLDHPGLFAIMAGEPGRLSPAGAAGFALLRGKVARIAAAGRLRVGVERAALLVHAAGMGAIHALLAQAEERRDPGLAAAARDAVLAAITGGPMLPEGAGPAQAAVALRGLLPRTDALTEAERALMAEWLDRIAGAETRP